jgi:hypothetical protein
MVAFASFHARVLQRKAVLPDSIFRRSLRHVCSLSVAQQSVDRETFTYPSQVNYIKF